LLLARVCILDALMYLCSVRHTLPAYSIISTVTDDLGKLGMGFPSTKLSTFVLFRTRSVCSKNFRAPFY